jgi:hypothetical protein
MKCCPRQQEYTVAIIDQKNRVIARICRAPFDRAADIVDGMQGLQAVLIPPGREPSGLPPSGSSDIAHDLFCSCEVCESVDLGSHGGGVPQDDAGRLDPELSADFGSGIVP